MTWAPARGRAGSQPDLRPAMAAVLLLATVVAAVGIGVRATFGGAAAVDEPQYLLTALSLAEDGDFDIADELAAQRWRDFHDSALPVQTERLPDDRQLSPHDPLLPLLLAPFMALGGWVAAKLAVAALGGLAAALTLWIAVRRFAVPLPIATGGVALAFASPPLAVYGNQVYPEMPAAAAVLTAVAALTGRLRRGGLALLVVAVVALPWLAVKYVPVAAVLALLGVARLAGGGRHRAAAATVGALAAAAAAYLIVHRLLWGGWTVYASGDHFQDTGEFAVVGVDPDYVGRGLRLVGLLADRGFGLAAWQPAWLLLVPAVAALVRRRPPGWRELTLPLAAGWLVATFVALTMHGYWWPGRQVVVVLPLALVAVLAWLAGPTLAGPALAGARRRTVALAGAVALAAVGVLALAALLVDGWTRQLTWVVGFEGVDDPVYQAWRGLLPDYRADGLGMWTRHVAWAGVLLALLVAGWRGARPHGPPAAHDPGRGLASPTEERTRAPSPTGGTS